RGGADRGGGLGRGGQPGRSRPGQGDHRRGRPRGWYAYPGWGGGRRRAGRRSRLMPLLARTVNTPLAIEVRRGAIAGLRATLADRRISAGGDVAVVVGPGQGATVAALVRDQLDAADVFPVAGGTLEAAQELADKLRARSYDAVVGIGGGKTIDTAKWAAARYGVPM